MASSGSFHNLLVRLQEEHELQLSLLRDEITSLQSELSAASTANPLRRAAAGGAESPKSHCHTQLPESDNAPVTVTRLGEGSRGNGHDLYAGEALKLKGAWTREAFFQNGLTKDEFEKLYTFMEHNDENTRTSRLIEENIKDKLKLPESKSWIRPFSPNSTARLYWDVVGLGLVCFDMINIPLQVYSLPTNWFTVAMDLITLIFWSCDMLQAFLFGYYEKGQLVMDLRKIAIHYLRTWFICDLLVVGPDWFLTIAGSQTKAGDLSRLLRGSRAIRVLRLLRIMKLQRVINKLYDLIDNESSFIVAELVKMMIVILVLNHVIACCWFLVGKITDNFGLPSWVNWTEHFLDSSIGYQYTTSLHWTLTQFTPASMDVVARNIVERVYSIVVLLFAMVAFSSIVGTVTSSMTVIRTMKNDKQKQFWMLRRYLKQKNVTLDLTMRMTRFLEHQILKQEKLIQAGKIVILQQISDQLARELAYEMYAPCLRKHVFFNFLASQMQAVAARICQVALKSQQIATRDMVFSTGEEAGRTFVIKGGDFRYIVYDGSSLDPPLGVQEWLAEAVLWTPWRYRGKLIAAAPSELLSLDAGRFVEAMSVHPKPMAIARHYGQMFVGLLNRQAPSYWTDVVRDQEFYDTAVVESSGWASENSDIATDDKEKEKERDKLEEYGQGLYNNKCSQERCDDQVQDFTVMPDDDLPPQRAAHQGRRKGNWFFTSVCFHPCDAHSPGQRR